jgi:hypothetical protein
MNVSKIVFDLGATKHGQPLRLELLGDGTYTLIREAANQRDDRVFIAGLTREHVRSIGSAAHTELGAL